MGDVVDDEGKRATYRAVFAVREFRALFAAQTLSVVGDQFTRVALAVLVYQRTSSASLTALTYALTFLPDIVARPLLSGLADSYPRRRVMVVADLARAALAALMAVSGMPILALCALVIAVQTVTAPFDAARLATLPIIFRSGDDDEPDDRYVVASSVSGMVYEAAQLVGFLGAGALLLGVSPSTALLANAATFLVSAALIRGGVVRRPAAGAGSESGLGSWARRIAAGARATVATARRRWLLALLCVPAFPVVAAGLTVPYAEQLGASAGWLGALYAAEPAGSLLGAVAINRIPPARRRQMMPALAIASCAVLLGCAAQPGLLGSIALLGLSGAFSAYFAVAAAEFVRSVPDAQRGQVGGLANTAVRVTQGIGVLAGGIMADVIPPAATIAAAGGIGALTALVIGVALHRASR